jgi:hypothetical protein
MEGSQGLTQVVPEQWIRNIKPATTKRNMRHYVAISPVAVLRQVVSPGPTVQNSVAWRRPVNFPLAAFQWMASGGRVGSMSFLRFNAKTQRLRVAKPELEFSRKGANS